MEAQAADRLPTRAAVLRVLRFLDLCGSDGGEQAVGVRAERAPAGGWIRSVLGADSRMEPLIVVGKRPTQNVPLTAYALVRGTFSQCAG